ncbi:hypothetical protein Q8A67_024410 [Cirrhinus molitorella]|uniref:Uncharacterized protein n=1 Tax=Cirrhinus molitorella TaxID=172907 RepID=A0AA88TBR9_9TELE|nr:hypothetical protein Q8A67_024410 [Cirrhinus molitorella]
MKGGAGEEVARLGGEREGGAGPSLSHVKDKSVGASVWGRDCVRRLAASHRRPPLITGAACNDPCKAIDSGLQSAPADPTTGDYLVPIPNFRDSAGHSAHRTCNGDWVPPCGGEE